MRIGLFTDGLAHLDRRAALAWCAEREICDVEMGVGTWGPRPHLDLALLLAERRARDRLVADLAEHGIALAAINAAGNPLHPVPAERRAAQDALAGAIDLAAALDVSTVVTMAGCPGGRHPGDVGVFAVPAVCADDERLWEWQLEHELLPFWVAASERAATAAPNVRICLELHPGVAIYNAETFGRLAERVGSNVGINLDPSHFWWQGIDPLRVIAAVGPAIGFAHGKDTVLHPDRIALHGVLDARVDADPADRPWHFCAVGDGHDDETWRALLAALVASGYDGVVSIEHEDPTLQPEPSIERSAQGLARALGLGTGGVRWQSR